MNHPLLTTALLFAVSLSTAGSLAAQGTALTPVRPGEKKPSLRKQFRQQVRALAHEAAVTGEAFAYLKDRFDGTPEAAMKANVVGLYLLRDRVRLLALVVPAQERLRQSLFADEFTARELAKQRHEQSRKTEQRLDREGRELLEARRTLAALPAGSPERQRLENIIANKGVVLTELIPHLEAQQKDARQQMARAEGFKKEREGLAGINARLAAIGEALSIRIERITQAIEQNSSAQRGQERREDRQAIDQIIGLLDSIPQGNGFPRPSIPTDDELEKRIKKQREGLVTRPLSPAVEAFLDRLDGDSSTTDQTATGTDTTSNSNSNSNSNSKSKEN